MLEPLIHSQDGKAAVSVCNCKSSLLQAERQRLTGALPNNVVLQARKRQVKHACNEAQSLVFANVRYYYSILHCQAFAAAYCVSLNHRRWRILFLSYSRLFKNNWFCTCLSLIKKFIFICSTNFLSLENLQKAKNIYLSKLDSSIKFSQMVRTFLKKQLHFFLEQTFFVSWMLHFYQNS